MKLSLLVKILLGAANVVAPGAITAATDIAALVKQLVSHVKSDLPPITHDDGTPISLDELDAAVEAKALEAHAAVHRGDLPPAPSGPEVPPADPGSGG